MTPTSRWEEYAGRQGPHPWKPWPAADGNGGGDGRLADGLGWLSLALGSVQLAAPGVLARAIGVPNTAENRMVLRGLGAREVASGIGILSRDRQAPWVWARVAGDAIDMALLGVASASRGARPRKLGIAAAAVAGVAALDVLAGKRQQRPGEGRRLLEHVTKGMTVNRPPAEVYEFWRNFENLPRFMRHLKSVTVTGPGRSRWVAAGPGGVGVKWDAETVEERPGEFLAWRSLPGSRLENSGWVNFRPAPGNRGTEVGVHLTYRPPAGRLGSAVAWMFGRDAEQQLREDMRRFKQVMETGEIARSDASGGLLGMRPGQPRTDVEPYSKFERGDR